MATSEALVKYYDCLKDSFNKIQDKDNEIALINAALRPKIREEFAKSDDVLNSYLNYIQVFCVIYNEKFNSVCSQVICPLFKEHKFSRLENAESTSTTAKLHQTLQNILKTKSSLAEEFAYCVVKVIPFLDSTLESNEFYLCIENCLQICSYLEGEPMSLVLSKILERMNPPKSKLDLDLQDKLKPNLIRAYDILYDFLNRLDASPTRDRVVDSLLTIIVREFLCADLTENMCHFLLYVCSLDQKYAELLVTLLWNGFADTSKPLTERRISVCFASLFLARAKYMTLEDLLHYLETSSNWCHEFLEDHSEMEIQKCFNERVEGFYAVAQSIFYLITQRYREMYEEETIMALNKLRLDKIIETRLKPLEHCDKNITERFREVATLYHLFNIPEADVLPVKKRRLSTESGHLGFCFILLRDESIPDRIKPLYRSYYEPKNFTVYRE